MNTELWDSDVPINLILVVEDDPDSAELMKTVLEREGFEVRVAKDGGQAQATFVMQKPDLVLLDLILPGESGYEICERLKHTNESVPVIVVSAIDLPESRELAEKVGADDYVTKPYDAVELISKIREVAKKAWERTHLGTGNDRAQIRLVCSCGKKFRVNSSHRGARLTCPQCGEPVNVPRT